MQYEPQRKVYDKDRGQEAGLEIAVLVSAGIHPASQRMRRAGMDARAIELALQMQPQRLDIVFAGDPECPALREYLGMGIARLQVLPVESACDPYPALLWWLRNHSPDLILTGCLAEQGESSGMIPYLLASALERPMVNNITSFVTWGKGHAEVLQALPRGQRRCVKVQMPLLASVDMMAELPRQSAAGPARRGTIDVCQQVPRELLCQGSLYGSEWDISAARKRPKRLAVAAAPAGRSAADRFKAATAKAASSSGTVIEAGSTSEKAQAMFDFLQQENVFR